MAKIASALLLLRKGGSTAWTSDLDNKMIAWSREYITWLENSELATDERDSEKLVPLPVCRSCLTNWTQQPWHLLLQSTRGFEDYCQ